MAKPAKHSPEMNAQKTWQIFDDASDFLWSATGQALSAGAALGLVFALNQAPVQAVDGQTFGDLESQVTVAKVDKDSKVFRDQKGRKYKMATPKVLQAEKVGGLGEKRKSRKDKFTGFALPALPALPLPALPALPLPSLPGGGGPGPGGPGGAGEDAAVGLLSGAAVSLGVPAVVVAGAVNSRIQEKKREDAERRAREAADPTGTILTAVAGVGAAVLVGNAILTNLPEAEEPEKTPVVATAADKAAAEKAAADKAAAAKAAADKAAAEKAAADKAAAAKAAADKAAAEKAAADKTAGEKAAADKAAAEKAAKAAAEKAAAEKAAAAKAAADKSASEKAVQKKVESAPAPPSGEESIRSKIAKKGGYFAYMKEKQQQSS